MRNHSNVSTFDSFKAAESLVSFLKERFKEREFSIEKNGKSFTVKVSRGGSLSDIMTISLLVAAFKCGLEANEWKWPTKQD